MTTPLLIYVAGPYRAPTAWQRDENIHRARRCGVEIARTGIAYPVIPHGNTAHFDGEAPDALWLEGTIALMKRCDGVVMIPGWRASAGARDERSVAFASSIPVLDLDGCGLDSAVLLRWIQNIAAIAKARGETR